RMSMMTAQRDAASPAAPAAESRSPFVRLTELIAGIEPGKAIINLSVGEPQHPIPPFVGPTLAAHVNEFGRYPANKGLEPFRRAVAQWLGRRYTLPRAVDPENEVLVLNGTREGLFLAGCAARRQSGSADPQSVLCRLCCWRARGRLRAGLSAGDARNRLLARPRRARRRAARAHRRVLPCLALESARRRRG